VTLTTILVPTDFSDSARIAAELAVDLADRDGGHVVLFHVSGLAEYSLVAVEPMYLPRHLWEQMWHRESQRIVAELDGLQAHLRARSSGRATIETRYLRTAVVDGIIGGANEVRADLIVIGSRGAGAGALLSFGSVAMRLTRESPCPVLVVPDSATSIGLPKRALVGVDYSQFSRPCLELAATVVGAAGEIVPVHVWLEPARFSLERSMSLSEAPAEFTAAVEKARAREHERIRSFASDFAPAVAAVTPMVVEGAPATTLLETASEQRVDLIVLGSHGRRGLERVVGTVADRVLRHAFVPVLLLPDRAVEGVHHADT
jgi:nucleotide-binding universal stress UspA family protein